MRAALRGNGSFAARGICPVGVSEVKFRTIGRIVNFIITLSFTRKDDNNMPSDHSLLPEAVATKAEHRSPWSPHLTTMIHY